MHIRLGQELEEALDTAWELHRHSSGEITKVAFMRRLLWLGLKSLHLGRPVENAGSR